MNESVFIALFNHAQMKALAGMIITALVALFGVHQDFAVAIGLLVMLDTIMGIVVAVREGSFAFKRLFRVVYKVALYGVTILAVSLFALRFSQMPGVGVIVGVLDDWWLFYLCLHELNSIITKLPADLSVRRYWDRMFSLIQKKAGAANGSGG